MIADATERLQDSYRWVAERPDGSAVVQGGDMSGCVRWALVPQRVGLPTHQVVGVPMERRFGRGFVSGMGGGYRDYLHCLVTPTMRVYVRSTDGGAVITPRDFELYL